MIKTVLFDLGNVILPFDLSRVAARLALYSPYSAEEILARVGPAEVVDAFETGLMDPHDYFNYLTNACRLAGLSFEQFVPLFNDIFDQNADVISLISTLKGKFHLGLISNTNPIHVDHIKATYEYLGHFDKAWYSNEAGLRKPNPALYKLALTHFSVDPHESVMIDDMKLNIDSALDLGMNAVHFQSPGQLMIELKTLGVLN
jgi:glucose-1-phosphatase